jgi:hypothetical protein
MADFANNATGMAQAEALCKTRMAAKTWVVAHHGVSVVGNVVCRFIRYMSPTNPAYGEWVESRDTAAT